MIIIPLKTNIKKKPILTKVIEKQTVKRGVHKNKKKITKLTIKSIKILKNLGYNIKRENE